MTGFVLDASVALSWFIDRTIAPYAMRVRNLLIQEGQAVVPAVWPLEIANGFVTAERRGLLSPSDTMELLQDFDVVLRSVEIDYGPTPAHRLIGSARHFRLTAYDAAYLELARERHLPIATLDRQLAAAARQASVPLIH
ncbi:MAG TPA: type II toxin-antitoxin system VapC family toxin [Candidatus Sulfotelmatobacter sp.]|nr:type II toxin-antitoxin system VapC family toxin [Candidatus Sulfotelmatobacter sp.]